MPGIVARLGGWSLVSVCGTPLARCQATGALEPPVEVALIGESESGGDGSDVLSTRQPAFRFIQTDVKEVRVKRESVGRLERAGQLKPAQRRHCRELMQPHVRFDTIVEIVAHAPDHVIVAARPCRAHRRNVMDREQA